ncbi:MAG: radical SAM protein [Candidatus Hodarchaeota archaeon]
MVNPLNLPLLKQSIQGFGRNLTKDCNKCGSNRFDSIIYYIFKKKNNICFNCRTQAKFFKFVMFRWLSFNKAESQTLYNISANTEIRKVLKNIFKGFALFGLRAPFVTGAPLSVVWNYTKKCNLKCSHCFSDSKFNQKSKKELSTDEAKQVIDIFAVNDVVTVNFCGGEPLTRDDLLEVMSYTQKNDICPSLSTNATLLTKDMCKKIYDVGVRSISISLDSISAFKHDSLRNVSGAYDMAINGINNAVEFGKFDELIINTTLTDFNYEEIPQIYEYVKDLGIKRYYVSRILPVGRGQYYMEHDVSNENKRKIMRFMAEKFIENVENNFPLEVLGRGMPYFSRPCYELSDGNVYPLCEILTGHETKYQDLFNGNTVSFLHRLNKYFSGCATGLFYCGLDCDGNVIPCAPAGNIKLGNILEKGLEHIWIYSPILNKIRKRNKVKGKCSSCYMGKICGGCRLTAYGLTGDWLESDLSCPY